MILIPPLLGMVGVTIESTDLAHEKSQVKMREGQGWELVASLCAFCVRAVRALSVGLSSQNGFPVTRLHQNLEERWAGPLVLSS